MEIVFRTIHKQDGIELSFDASKGEVQISVIGAEEQIDFSMSYNEWYLLDSFINDQKRRHEQNENEETTT